MTRVIHTADTHIGYRQYHSPERKQDFLRAFGSVVDDAIEADVDAVVHGGDLFHDTRPDLTDLMGTIRILRELADADIPFLGIVGNHERTRERQWLDLIADLGLAVRLDETGTRIGDVTFYGLDWIPPAQRDKLAYEFEPPETAHTALVAHGLFEPFAHADWETETLLESATVDFDALLLGDNHIPERAEVADTWVTYPGSTERTSASEREDRGYNLLTFEDGVRIRRRAIEDTRTFVFLDETLSGDEGTQRICDRVREHDVEDAVVVVRIDGEGGDVAPAVVEETAAAEGALITRLVDNRERETEGDRPSVEFSDPDRAVTGAIDDLGMSVVGHMIDDLVRDRTVPDATVRERVRGRVETLLGEELAAFEPAPEADDGTDVASEPETPDEPDTPTDDEPEPESPATDGEAEREADAAPDDDPATAPAATDAHESTTEENEGQTSIGEFK